MLKASNDERGTVTALAKLSQDLDDIDADAGQAYALSPRHHKQQMSTETYQLLAFTICCLFPLTPVHCRSDHPVVPHSLPLNRHAVFFDYVVIDVGTNWSSLVHVIIPGPHPIHAYGEILKIFQFDQKFHAVDEPLWFSRMRWFVPWRGECERVWSDFYSTDLRLWKLGEYADQETQLLHLIDPD
ncbi:hypothetical protein BDR04DRAFT_1149040 [Suillus decipiens]|nr:hypothetical protein BDR04DRAFT_1149040 [Suillus decipiens]